MAYLPSVNADTLELYIGTPAMGVATASSTALTGVTFVQLPGQSAPCTFTPADVGCPIAIIGGGAVNAYMPGGYLIQGSTFVTTIAAYVSATAVTLTAAPVTSISSSSFPIIVVYRRCLLQSDVATGALGINFSSSVAPGTRDTLSFTVQPYNNPYITRFQTIARGQPVYLKSSDAAVGDIFGGQVYSRTISNYVGVPGVFSWTCTCASYQGIALRRLVRPTNPGPQTFSGAADVVFAQVVCTYLDNEGVGVDATTGGGTITITCAAGQYISAILDQIVTLLSTPTSQWIWYVDEWRNFVLQPSTATAAPWNISDGSDLLAGDSPYQMTLTDTADQLATAVFGSGSSVGTAATADLVLTEQVIFAGGNLPVNIQSTGAVVPQPLTSVPTITLAGVGQTVGTLGATGSDWYWSQGSSFLYQDISGTTWDPATQVLEITSAVQGGTAIPQSAQAFNLAGIQQVANTEASTGDYDHWIQISAPIAPGDLLSEVQTYANQYGTAAKTFSAYTMRPGLQTGQLISISLSQFGFSGQFLIATIQMTTVSNVIQWQFTAFSGANVGSAVTGLVQFINRALPLPQPAITAPIATSGPAAPRPGFNPTPSQTVPPIVPTGPPYVVDFPGPSVSGDLLLCYVAQITSATFGEASGIIDTAGNAWTRVQANCVIGSLGQNLTLTIFSCLSSLESPGPLSLTVTGTFTSPITVALAEFTGAVWTGTYGGWTATSGSPGSIPSISDGGLICLANSMVVSAVVAYESGYSGGTYEAPLLTLFSGDVSVAQVFTAVAQTIVSTFDLAPNVEAVILNSNFFTAT